MSLKYSVLGYTADSVAMSLENVIYLELCRRGYTVYIGKACDGEIDFGRSIPIRRNTRDFTVFGRRFSTDAAKGAGKIMRGKKADFFSDLHDRKRGFFQ